MVITLNSSNWLLGEYWVLSTEYVTECWVCSHFTSPQSSWSESLLYSTPVDWVTSLVLWCCHGDYGAHHEMVNTLVELVTMKRSPWRRDHDWSDDISSLLQIAIRTPWIVNDEFICNHFHSLRLIDKCVSVTHYHHPACILLAFLVFLVMW